MQSKSLIRQKPVEQLHLAIGYQTIERDHELADALQTMSSVLGGSMSSRLFQEVREKLGLAYSVYSYPSYYTDCGMFEIYAGLSPANIAKVCNLLQQELLLIVDKGISETELNRAKAQAVNGLYMNLESNMTLMRLYGRCMLKTGELYSPENEVENYKALTVQQVNEVAREIFSQKFASSYVGRENKHFDAISKIKIN